MTAFGVLLEDLTWLQAEQVLGPETVVVFPIGAAAKEHGPHLLLKNDLLIANYLRDRVLAASEVVVAPTLNYHHYPAFSEYPGSTSLAQDTARDVVVDICRSLAAYGPKRFYLLNTGVSTERALEPAVAVLQAEGILARYTKLSILNEVEKRLGEQEGGSHADEIETSMMLYIAPESVDMAQAVSDYHPRPGSGLTRNLDGQASFSPSGVYGDATLATEAKGREVVEFLVKKILAEIEELRAQSQI
ncbi:MAG: creatininase family protein [Acidimicrobiales bacterium]